MLLSVIIVNYRVYPYLADCIQSVQQALSGIESEIIVVDNEAVPEEIRAVQHKFPDIEVIVNNVNNGYSRANNQGFAISRGEYVLFLNPDTLVLENALRQCVDYIQQNPGVGGLGVRMVNEAGVFLPESKRAFPTPLTAFFKLSGLAALFPRSAVFNRYALGNLNESANHRVEVLAGAFLMTRKSILDQLKGFDERFFMYGEDVDLSRRILDLNYENHYLGSVTILHYKGASTDRHSRHYNQYFYNSMKLFVEKYYRGTRGWAIRQLLNSGIYLFQQGARIKNRLF
ncbi:MAG: glycosyltransferase family 2 protein [Sediminibacterium sp.]|nr:glycosyltransferase family 2 protein [Sediminibacterium sp.]